ISVRLAGRRPPSEAAGRPRRGRADTHPRFPVATLVLPALKCPACGNPHDFYYAGEPRVPFSATARNTFTCPAKKVQASLVPNVAGALVTRPPFWAVELTREGG